MCVVTQGLTPYCGRFFTGLIYDRQFLGSITVQQAGNGKEIFLSRDDVLHPKRQLDASLPSKALYRLSVFLMHNRDKLIWRRVRWKTNVQVGQSSLFFHLRSSFVQEEFLKIHLLPVVHNDTEYSSHHY